MAKVKKGTKATPAAATAITEQVEKPPDLPIATVLVMLTCLVSVYSTWQASTVTLSVPETSTRSPAALRQFKKGSKAYNKRLEAPEYETLLQNTRVEERMG